uniref:Glycosyltransferase family 92 protein n=1 Tax=Caenorhabditis tropicalis TaxID=1561998 RepID=A0A1I7V417_9PELO
MGRDVQYSPFTWQSQSTAHNRFLKFLVFIIFLALLSFYFGFPEQATPKPEPRAYRLEEILKTSESETKFEPPTGHFEVPSSESRPTENAVFPSAFEESVVSSDSFGEKLKILEEEERKIIESQEDEFGKRDEVENSTSGGIPEDQPAEDSPSEATEVESSTSEGNEGIPDDKTAEDNGSKASEVENKVTSEAPETEVTSEASETTSGDKDTTKSSQFPSQRATERVVEGAYEASEAPEAPEAEASVSQTTPADEESSDTTESQFPNSEATDRDVEELSTSEPESIGIEEAEKQVEQVSANLTLIEETTTTEVHNETSTESDLTNFSSTDEQSTTGNLETETDVKNTTVVIEESTTLGNDASNETSSEPTTEKQVNFDNLPECRVEEWNNMTLDEVPHQSVHRQWVEESFGTEANETGGGVPKALGAFTYKDHIAVTFGTVYCRYYDCNKKQMVRQATSFVYPESTVYCPRRAGAKFISISESLEDKGKPVEIQKRLVPHHFFTICVRMSNDDILKVSRFLEYYKLQGSTFFHFYLQNSSHYERMLLDEYVRTGDVKVIKIGENVTKEAQANDCQHRTKYFSKWTAFLNLEDELRMSEASETISAYLDSVTDHKTNILRWSNEETSRVLIRPERIVSINQSPIKVYLGNQLEEEREPSGTFRTFSTSSQLNPENFSENVAEDVAFRDELIENVITRTRHVFSTMESDKLKEGPSSNINDE